MWSLIVSAGLFITANCLPFPQNQPRAVQASVVPVQALPQPLRPGPNTTPVPIISQTDVENGGGNFTFGFEAGNGIQVQETGYLKQGPPLAKSANQNEDNSIQVILGSFSYPAPDGSNITLTYVADENGFQPQGNHLPTPPPLPESVQRLLSTLQSNAAANGNAPALQASPSANYENIVNPPLASRSAKALESNAAPVAAVQPVSIAASTPKVVASSTTIAPAVPPEQVN